MRTTIESYPLEINLQNVRRWKELCEIQINAVGDVFNYHFVFSDERCTITLDKIRLKELISALNAIYEVLE